MVQPDPKFPKNQNSPNSNSLIVESKFSKLQKFFDRNGRYIQWVGAGVGILGLVVISRSIRLGTKFTNVAAIPREFYEKNVNFYGQIKGIDGGNSKVIFVEHLPILQLKKWKSENEFLRLEIPGLEFTQLTTNLDLIKNRNIKIKFTLLEINERNQAAMCLVYHRRFLLMANFGVWCVRNKIAKISSAKLLEELPPRIWNNSKFEIYYKPLLKLEKLESESKTKNGKFYLKIWNKLKYFTSKLK